MDIFRRRAPWILLCAALVAGAAYAVSKQQTRRYTATASLVFNGNQLLGQQLAGSPAAPGSADQQALPSTNLKLVRFGDIAAKTAAAIGEGVTTQSVNAGLRVSAPGDAGVVNVSDTATAPALAAAIANTYTAQFVVEQHSRERHVYASALKLVKEQLAGLSAKERAGAAGLALRNRAQSLKTLDELSSRSVKVSQAASVPTSPSSPKLVRNTILGGVAGLLLGLLIALVLAGLDRRIRDPRELAAIYELPLLGIVPQSRALDRSARRGKNAKKALPPWETEAFNLLRAHVRSFNVEIELGTLLVVSAAPGDGKTTVARHFASAAARRGRRVVLLEADLRHPTLARQLDVQPGPGLVDVLTGTMSLSEVTQMVELDSPSGEDHEERTLDVAVAGSARPPNPGELIESHAMEVLLARAKATYDLVVIDTPPLIAVSDAFPLVGRVDGVMIVGRVGCNRHDVVERLHEILMGAGAPLLGVVANGFKVRRRGSFGYSYDYASTQAGRPATAEVSNNGTHPHGASANGASPSGEPVPAQPVRSMPPTYGEAVDLDGLLGDLPGEPEVRQSRRSRRRRATRGT